MAEKTSSASQNESWVGVPMPMPKVKGMMTPIQGYPDSDESDNGKVPAQPVPAPVSVPTQHRDNAQRQHTKHRQGALKRLGLAPDQMSGVPRISHLLSQAEGGLPTVISALRLSDDPEAQQFLACYDRTSDSDLQHLTLEEIVVASGVQVKRLLELAVSALVEDSRSAGAIIAASYHTQVIRATAESGIRWADSHNDRRLFLQGTGFLPQSVSKSQGGVFVTVNNAQVTAVPDTPDAPEPDPSAKFNAAEDDLIRLHSVIDGDKLLEAPKEVVNAAQIQIGHVYKDEDLECVPVPMPVPRQK